MTSELFKQVLRAQQRCCQELEFGLLFDGILSNLLLKIGLFTFTLLELVGVFVEVLDIL